MGFLSKISFLKCCQTDSKETDYCGVYRDELINSTECGTAMYGFMNRTSIPQHELCG